VTLIPLPDSSSRDTQAMPMKAARATRTVKAEAAGDAAPVPEEEKMFMGIKVATLQKVIPLGAMFFCILFNYTILRDTKVSERPAHPP
jgi:hypothetical protein